MIRDDSDQVGRNPATINYDVKLSSWDTYLNVGLKMFNGHTEVNKET